MYMYMLHVADTQSHVCINGALVLLVCVCVCVCVCV